MKRKEFEKAAKAEVENIVFYNICSEEIDNEESNYEAGRRDALYDFGEELFIAGANWRIDGIWRNIKESPTCKSTAILAVRFDGSVEKVFFTTLSKWKSLVKHCKFIQWAYIQDLLPNLERCK